MSELELGAIEARLEHAVLPYLRDEVRQLIAAARELRELKSALEFTAKATLNHAADDEGFPTFAEALFATATELGWDPKGTKDG